MISTAPATAYFSFPDKTNERKPAAARHLHPDLFQDHLVLETLCGFRIILGLENANRVNWLGARHLASSRVTSPALR